MKRRKACHAKDREETYPSRSNERNRTVAKTRTVDAAGTIRQIGNDWARHWNAGELDEVVAAYAADAVYLPPHRPAVHGRDSIREYLKAPLSHGVSDLAFDVTYIKQQGPVAWDVGTYRMKVPVNDELRKVITASISLCGDA